MYQNACSFLVFNRFFECFLVVTIGFDSHIYQMTTLLCFDLMTILTKNILPTLLKIPDNITDITLLSILGFVISPDNTCLKN